MDGQTGERTDRARFIHIQMRALYDRANESENAFAHLGLEFTARGVKARRVSPVDLFVICRICRLFLLRTRRFLGFTQRGVSHLSAFLLTSDTIQTCRESSTRILIRVEIMCRLLHLVRLNDNI